MQEHKAEQSWSRGAGSASQVVIDGVRRSLVPRADVEEACPDSVTVSHR